jgi:hypothetical protein
MQYGVPASGILCVELLKQDRNLRTSSCTVNPICSLPRSEIIQHLTLFVAFLDWVKPAAPNADLCMRVKEIVARVLDRVLDPFMHNSPVQLRLPVTTTTVAHSNTDSTTGHEEYAIASEMRAAMEGVSTIDATRESSFGEMVDLGRPNFWGSFDEVNWDLMDTFDWVG